MESPIHFNPFSPSANSRTNSAGVHHSKRHFSATSPVSRAGKRKRSTDDVDMECAPHAHTTTFSPSNKKTRNLPVGRPLPLPRLLDSLDREGMRDLLKHLCERQPGLSSEVAKQLPRPGVQAALQSLQQLERHIQLAFPFGGDIKGEYAYNRVSPAITQLLEALADYVPSFLPPYEPHALDALAFLDGATGIIARLPEWHNINHMLSKRQAFEEMNGAWTVAFAEAAKRGGGVAALGYLEKLREWNTLSGGLLGEAVSAATQALEWTVGMAPAQQQPMQTWSPHGTYAAAGFGFGMPC
ncbi:Cut8 six-helix bundle-domain-containing protein [Protomyces lactucae-debilis]|uniref:Tethering factor for nuclear proteasome STS1 n=1 Tax=Protomyces lactucae-debilis TaxID=2754530 RepID=A0A1Y2FGI7_PROLT|nr:Cut8 six-helix bundle-domain-containing protein [Protomyces lactucae-debilis]ORY83058.1 Cut8 six-helix bundle-domain-containing protein [Protomyces lactucae-debilis]